ncbi:putative motility protein [Terrarubrum flagellatum]|uniref:putative motility protein n=1 Tax=Terrirubrum flagellatum TaxID=2895980 RepID=UPI0031454487
MDSVSLAQGVVAANVAKTQNAVAAKLMKMNVDANKSIADLLESASNNLQALADAANPAGVGGNLDIKA